MSQHPEVYVTERGSEALPAAFSQTLTQGRVYEYIYVIQNSHSFNGPVDITVSGGTDLAGNTMNGDYRTVGLIVTDTLAPVLNPHGTIPSDGKELTVKPSPIRINLHEHAESVEPVSGVSVEHSSVTVYGPLRNGSFKSELRYSHQICSLDS